MGNKFNVASLFSGCGGMDLGFEGGFNIPVESMVPERIAGLHIDEKKYVQLKKLNFDTVFACDVNAKARMAWEIYFSKKRNIDGVYQEKSSVDIVKQIKNGDQKNLKSIQLT